MFAHFVFPHHECGSQLSTANRAVGGWCTVFADPVIATANFDRLLQRGEVIAIRGDSCCLREIRRA